MTEISENVYALAKRVVRSADFTTITITELVAQAIKVERERCMSIVAHHGIESMLRETMYVSITVTNIGYDIREGAER